MDDTYFNFLNENLITEIFIYLGAADVCNLLTIINRNIIDYPYLVFSLTENKIDKNVIRDLARKDTQFYEIMYFSLLYHTEYLDYVNNLNKIYKDDHGLYTLFIINNTFPVVIERYCGKDYRVKSIKLGLLQLSFMSNGSKYYVTDLIPHSFVDNIKEVVHYLDEKSMIFRVEYGSSHLLVKYYEYYPEDIFNFFKFVLDEYPQYIGISYLDLFNFLKFNMLQFFDKALSSIGNTIDYNFILNFVDMITNDQSRYKFMAQKAYNSGANKLISLINDDPGFVNKAESIELLKLIN